MKRIRKHSKDVFTRHKKERPDQNELQVSRFISEGNPAVDIEANEDLSSDEQLLDNIQEALEKDLYLSAIIDNIQVIVENGIVTLEGAVFTQEEKDLAEEKAAVFVGVHNINNHLDVLED